MDVSTESERLTPDEDISEGIPCKIEALPRGRAEIQNRVLTLTAPALGEMFLMSFVSIVDMMMVGQLGAAAITAVGLTFQPMLLLQSVFMALNVGTTAVMAQCIGANRFDEANKTAKQSLLVSLALGIVVSTGSVVGAPYVLKFMGADAEVMKVGIGYFRVVCGGIIFNCIAMSIAASLRGSGDTRTPMLVNGVANILNVFGNYALIFGHFGMPALGVFGAGLSTTASRGLATLLFIPIALKGKGGIRLSARGSWKPDRVMLSRIWRVGWPAAMEQLIMRGGHVLYARVVSGLGTAIYASHQIGLNILSLTFLPGQAFSIASTTLVGQSLGANDPVEAESCARETHRLGLLVGSITAIALFIFGRQIAWLYIKDPDVISNTALLLKIYALAQPAQSTQFILAGALRGAGDTKWPLYSTIIGVWAVRLVLASLFINTFSWGLAGAWVALDLDQVARTVVLTYRFKDGSWKEMRV
jgi:putative MATE family efflux protein